MKAVIPILLAIVALPCVAAIAPTYPVKPIRWIVPYPAGGGSDTVARALAPRLQESFG